MCFPIRISCFGFSLPLKGIRSFAFGSGSGVGGGGRYNDPMARVSQPALWRLFLPLAPWMLLFLLLYAALRPFGMGWVAGVVTGALVALLLVYLRFAGRGR